jgi:hypothetical protein
VREAAFDVWDEIALALGQAVVNQDGRPDGGSSMRAKARGRSRRGYEDDPRQDRGERPKPEQLFHVDPFPDVAVAPCEINVRSPSAVSLDVLPAQMENAPWEG